MDKEIVATEPTQLGANQFRRTMINTSSLSVRPRADHELTVPGNPVDISCRSLSTSALTLSLNFLLFGYDVFYSPP